MKVKEIIKETVPEKMAEEARGKLQHSLKIRDQINFWLSCMRWYGYGNELRPLTKSECGMLRNLNLIMRPEEGVTATAFMEYGIKNWKEIMVDHNYKYPVPTFTSLYYIKEKIMGKLVRGVSGIKDAPSSQRVITKFEDLPKDHPDYETMVKIFKRKGVVRLNR